MKSKDIIRQEIIGSLAEVIDSKNKSNIGIKGKIIDETKNTIIIEDKQKRKRLFKNNITLKITIKNQTAAIQGKLLSGKPKDRTK
jgi:ribonuclease P protein subunit POP4